MSHATETHDMPARRIEAVGDGLRTAIIALIVVGAIAFVAALLVDESRAWRAYYINWLFITSIAQGGFMLAVVTSIAKGVWSRPIRRIALAHSAFLPIAFVAVLPILIFGAPHIWPWIDHPLQTGKEAWLNWPFLTARTLFGLALLFGVSLAFTYTALRPDMGLMRDRVPPRLQGMYGAFSRNWRGQEAEELHAYRRLLVLGPAAALIYALIMGVLAWDFVMSLEPKWFSTLIGPYLFMGAILGGAMTTALITIALRHRAGLGNWILPSTLHDLGKLCFGFTVFWGYMFFSQYIVIWYGLLSWEQEFIINRFVPPFRTIAQLVAVLLFVVPFFGLMGVAAKRTPAVFATIASISLLGLWLERWLLVYPSLWIGAEDLPLSWPEPGLLLLFVGLYLAAISFFLTRVPTFQIWQPLSEIELQGIAVQERSMTGDLGGAGSRPEQ
ncbi:polysulfide reductase NrfD [soil metagenome]